MNSLRPRISVISKTAIALWMACLVWVWFVGFMQIPETDKPLKKFVRTITMPSKVLMDKFTFRPSTWVPPPPKD